MTNSSIQYRGNYYLFLPFKVIKNQQKQSRKTINLNMGHKESFEVSDSDIHDYPGTSYYTRRGYT